MGIEALIAALAGVAGVVGGYVGGKRTGQTAALSTAMSTVELLQIQVNTLTSDGTAKDAIVTDLRARVELLEQLVTQRARVEEVYSAIEGVRSVVDQIKERVDGAP